MFKGGNYLGVKYNAKECSKEGYFRDTQDCKKFYRCVLRNGFFDKYEYICPPPKVVFDEKLG